MSDNNSLPPSSKISSDSRLSLNMEDKSSNEKIRLKPQLTLLNGITVIVGSIIGSGIFVSPTGVLRNSGSIGASLLVWILSGVFSMIGAYCYIELGTMIHRSGGDYAYVLEAFGRFFGFLRLWVEVIVARPCSLTIVAMTFAKYMLYPVFIGCEEPESAGRLLAAVCIIILTFVNCASVKASAYVQDLFTYAKVLGLVIIIITGCVQIALGKVENFQNMFDDTSTNPGDYASAFYSGLWAYSGWHYLNCLIEEMKNPKRDLPLAIFISTTIVIVIYVLTNIAYFTTATPVEVLASPAVAVTFGNRIYGSMWWMIPVFVSLSTFGGANGCLLTTSRMFFVAAQENQMPLVTSMVQVNRLTPVMSVIVVCVVSLCYLCLNDIYQLINYMGFVNWIAIGLSVFIVIFLRFKEPERERPVRVHLFYPIFYVILTAILCIFAFVGAPFESIMGCVIILTGIPVYIVFVAWKNKPRIIQNKIDAFTILIQKLFIVVNADKDE